MNRIYKSVWNAVTRSWTAVSEWQKSRTKKSKAKLFLPLSITLISGTVLADNWHLSMDDIVFGDHSSACTRNSIFDGKNPIALIGIQIFINSSLQSADVYFAVVRLNPRCISRTKE